MQVSAEGKGSITNRVVEVSLLAYFEFYRG